MWANILAEHPTSPVQNVDTVDSRYLDLAYLE